MNDFNWDKGYSDGKFKIPEYMLGGLKRYVMFGLAPGHFLSAVICNDLFGAVGHADSANLMHLPAYVRFFYNVAPSQCWGDRDALIYWQRVGGWNGLMTLDEKYPTKGGLCVVCVERENCPVPGLVKDQTMAVPRPDLDEDGNVEWCPIYYVDEEDFTPLDEGDK